MKKIFLFVLFLAVLFLSAPVPGWAECPDKMKCGYWTDSFPPEQKIKGTVDLPTCYKFGSGCRPWHCDGGNYKSETQCKDICVQNFPELKGKKIYMEFPLL